MWVRKSTSTKMYSDTGAEINIIPVGGYAFSEGIRVFGARAVSCVVLGDPGGPLSEAGFMVSQAESPTFPNSAGWALANSTGCGMGAVSADITSTTAISNYGGINITGFPISTTNTPAPGLCITARWARARMVNGSTAPVAITKVSVAVVFDGDAAPVAVSGTGYTTKAVSTTYIGSATIGSNSIAAIDCGLTLKNGSLVAYTSGLPVLNGPMYTADVNPHYFRLVKKPGSTAYLLSPTAYSNKTITIYNLVVFPDANTL